MKLTSRRTCFLDTKHLFGVYKYSQVECQVRIGVSLEA